MDNVRVVLADLPASVRAYTICKDDWYTVVMNNNMSYEQRCKSYLHEIQHIENGDFEQRISADLIEFHAHK